MHDKHNSTTENDEKLSWNEEIDDLEEMGIISSNEKNNLFNITKGTSCPKKAPKTITKLYKKGTKDYD